MTAPQGSAPFADRLLVYVRQRFGTSIGYASPPAPVHGGYDTLIYGFELSGAPEGWQGPLIARVFRDENGVNRARFEGVAQAVIAAQGFPCPAPVDVQADPTVLGGAFIIMRRAPGKPLLSAGAATVVRRLPRILAETHARLHALDPEKVRAGFREAGLEEVALRKGLWLPHLTEEIERESLNAFAPALSWLKQNQPQGVELAVCHLDFHPLNVLFDGNRVTGVIDWSNASLGDPAADVAISNVIMTMGPLDAGRLQPAADLARRWLARRYLAAYQEIRPLDPLRIRYYEALRCFAAMVNAAGRRKSGVGPERGGYAWDQPAQVRMMTSHFRRVSGLLLPGPREAAGD
jgi:aminoglycoside phosphotransferase (APT) family kinase protein